MLNQYYSVSISVKITPVWTSEYLSVSRLGSTCGLRQVTQALQSFC